MSGSSGRATRFLQSFITKRDGNVAMIFGLAIIPLFAVAGFSIDFSRTMSAKSHLQAALDASSLAAARALEDATKTDAEITTIATAMFQEDLRTSQGDLSCNAPSVNINRISGQVRVDANCDLPMTLSSILSVDQATVGNAATARAAVTELDVAMMLDVSGSMGGQKLIDLKAAAKDAAATLVTPQTGDRVRVAFNTYSTSVNAGVYAEKVLRDFDDLNNDGLDDDGDTTTCVTERTGVAAWTDEAPGINRWLRNETDNCPSSSVLPLTNDLETFNKEIDALVADGYTAGHLGVAWSWYLISDKWKDIWPAASAPKDPSDPKVIKAVILMTDGQFNRTYESTLGDTNDQAKTLCQKMRNDGVIIYSVAFQAPADAKATLKNCAGGDARFFDASDGDELKLAYSAIASQLGALALID